jgi:hypothetical protein
MKLDKYLLYLLDQGPGGSPGGPPAKVIHLKASGAEQDDEEPPTTARTKKFERDEAKVGLKEFDIVGTAAQIATNPRTWAQGGIAAAGYATAIILQQKKKKKICQQKYPNNPPAIKSCMGGVKPQP